MGNDIRNMPLAGVRVLELATIVAAPTSARMLCAYGAEVIKVEALNGDNMRKSGARRFTPCTNDLNPFFTVSNSNKKLIAINYKTKEGMDLLLKLIGSSDIFITNIREKSLVNSGLDYESLKDAFPRLIYAHFKGYGSKGPSADDPGYDISAFWLRSGPLSDWQTTGSFPFNPSYAFGDVATGSVFLAGILMALYARSINGHGTKVETSLFAHGIWCNSFGIVQTQFEQKHLNPDPFRPSDPFSQVYKCKDGRWIGIYCNDYVKDLPKFARLLGMEDIVDDPGYKDIATLHRTGTIETAVRRINKIFLEKTSDEWRAFFSGNNVACEIMKEIHEVSEDPQALDNEYVVPLEYPDEAHTRVMMPMPPIAFSEYGRRDYRPAGVIGADTDEIMSDLGYSPESIKQMKDEGAVR